MITLLPPRVGVFVSNCYSIIMQRFGFSFALELRRLRKMEPATSSPVQVQLEEAEVCLLFLFPSLFGFSLSLHRTIYTMSEVRLARYPS